jgi:hypothetical protein
MTPFSRSFLFFVIFSKNTQTKEGALSMALKTISMHEEAQKTAAVAEKK